MTNYLNERELFQDLAIIQSDLISTWVVVLSTRLMCSVNINDMPDHKPIYIILFCKYKFSSVWGLYGRLTVNYIPSIMYYHLRNVDRHTLILYLLGGSDDAFFDILDPEQCSC